MVNIFRKIYYDPCTSKMCAFRQQFKKTLFYIIFHVLLDKHFKKYDIFLNVLIKIRK